MLSYHFSMFKTNIGIEQMVEDISMMSFAAKWLESDEAIYMDVSRKKNPRDDAQLLNSIRSVLTGVDFFVAHNGQRFDLPQINSRMVQQGIAPYRTPKVIDTLLLNKRVFRFSSHRLAYVTRQIGDVEKYAHSKFPGFSMWTECLAGNKEAWEENRLYNMIDVTSLESTYLRTRGWYEAHPNLGPYVEDSSKPVCPNCGSNKLKLNSTPHRTGVGIYDSYTCGNCGATPRGRILIASRDERKHITVR
jgi:predicted RNA-binding Zn-ribbon protein involved in translation (DUF1610 family)